MRPDSLVGTIALRVPLVAIAVLALLSAPLAAQTLPGTEPLTWEGDLAARMVAGVDQFLLNKIEQSAAKRERHWQRNLDSAAAYQESVEPNRKRLAERLGVRDERREFGGLELLATTSQPALVGRGDGFKAYAVRWPVLRNMYGEGLLLVPDEANRLEVDVVAIPDADQTPEQLAGLADGLAADSQFARRLAEAGCRVVVPTLVSREMQRRAPPGQAGRANLSNREYVHRSAYELGRHLAGYETQKVLAAVDWFERDAATHDRQATVAAIGYGEGGMLALYAGALDTRIDVVAVCGYFGPRETIWQQPIDRNVFGLLEQFGDAEVASLIAPRPLVIDAVDGPTVDLPSEGGAPATLRPFTGEQVTAEVERLRAIVGPLKLADGRSAAENVHLVQPESGPDAARAASDEALRHLLVEALAIRGSDSEPDELVRERLFAAHESPRHFREGFSPADRQRRQLQEIDEHNQWLLEESPYTRAGFINIGLTRDDRADGANKLDTSSAEAYAASVERFREVFRHDVVGHFDDQPLPFAARSRVAYDEPAWTGYEVVLDVFPDVFAYGILCLPKNIPAGERRPVVVCQHGLEGRPQDIVTGDHPAYHDFAAKLAERGYITFSPQNLYIGKDDFRTLQRKAYPLKKTLFSIIVPQHQQIVDWLQTLPQVDGDRIGFYGLSYGGKSAMRIPALVTDYALSICSADFNDWVWKNASTRATYSYVWTGEYEIFEFDLGSTFNYAEMAALIAPRPFMVERGHFDGVGSDERVAAEFARVRHLYNARLKLPDRCEIEWFPGPHTINGQGTFAFIDRHLKPSE